MKIGIIILVLVIIISIEEATSSCSNNYTQPITPTCWQQIAKGGFSTNYFKTLNFKNYKKQNLADVYAKGFRNLRLRCRADLDGLVMSTFLSNLETVVDDCLAANIVPIITWIHHDAEAFANSTHRQGYLDWWEAVAKRLKDKDYRLVFNLFTELGIDACGNDCSESLKYNIDKYHDWTTNVIKKIRGTGSKNANRILILASPIKTGDGLEKINQTIYKGETYMMAEWHTYASGPNKKILSNGKPTTKYWSGNGTTYGQDNVNANLKLGSNFTATYKMNTYFGAWMPQDNKGGDLNQTEVINFAKYFVSKITIPWSINVLDVYYDTKNSKWRTEVQNIKGVSLNMSLVLDAIISVM